jgi:hypothetical protein
MSIASLFRKRIPSRAILTVAMDDHNVHCMTEDMLDEWFHSLDAAQKADIFDYILGEPDVPSDPGRGASAVSERLTGLIGLNSITVGLPTLGTPAQGHGEPLDPCRRDEKPTLRTLLRKSLDQLDQVGAPHAASLHLGPVEVLR